MTHSQLASIHIFPVKSLAGIEVDHWPVDRRGLYLDRHWMIVDRDGHFISQRSLPRMALINTALDRERLSLSLRTEGMPDLHIPFEPAEDERIQTTIWDDNCQACCVGAEADGWLSTALKQECRLVSLPNEGQRIVDQDYAGMEDEVGFADGFPFLLIGSASLDELNRRLQEPVEMRRFRPNLVVRTGTPHIEDRWQRITIGELSFRLPKPCSRCAIPNVDPDTGIRSGGEPIKTLASYRKSDNKIYFGQNALHDSVGNLSAGDTVNVIEVGLPQHNL